MFTLTPNLRSQLFPSNADRIRAATYERRDRVRFAKACAISSNTIASVPDAWRILENNHDDETAARDYVDDRCARGLSL